MGFSHSVTGTDVCFEKITWAARGGWIFQRPAMHMVYQSTGSCRDTGERGGSLRLRKREINSQIEIEVGSVINGVHV